jgi:hypothetical protein
MQEEGCENRPCPGAHYRGLGIFGCPRKQAFSISEEKIPLKPGKPWQGSKKVTPPMSHSMLLTEPPQELTVALLSWKITDIDTQQLGLVRSQAYAD